MSHPPDARAAPARVDPVALRRVWQRLHACPQAPWLHTEVARRMADRLSIVRRRPAVVLDWGAQLGAGHALLAAAYPEARLVSVLTAPTPDDQSAARRSRPAWSWRRWGGGSVAAASPPDLPDGGAGLVWSNMQLHFAADPAAEFGLWLRTLAVDGFLMFSTLGPGTLAQLRELYRRAGWPAPMAPLMDMHDLGDLLVRQGYADPVMDQETLSLNWPSAAALRVELRGLGGNVAPDRYPGLRTPRWQQQLDRRLTAELAGAAGPRLQLEVEVVYGHAFKAAPRRGTQETRVPVEQLRQQIRGRLASG